MAFEHILIAVDDSPASEEATRVGLEIATAAGGEVMFVHGDRDLAENIFEENPRSTETREQRLGIASAVHAGLVVVHSPRQA